MAKWVEPLYCTAYDDISGEDEKYENQVQSTLGKEFSIETADLWMGKEGVGLEVRTTQEQRDMMQQPRNVTPHVTLRVAKRRRAREIGLMVP